MANITTAGFQRSVPLPTEASIGSPVIAYEGDPYGVLPWGSTVGAIAQVDLTIAKGVFWAGTNQENSYVTNVNGGGLAVAGIVLRANATSFGYVANADAQGYSTTIAAALNADILISNSVWVKIDVAAEVGTNTLYGSAIWVRDSDGALISQVQGTAVAGATLSQFRAGNLTAAAAGTLIVITTNSNVSQ